MKITLLLVLFAALVVNYTHETPTTCKRQSRKIGCFEDNIFTKDLLITDRDVHHDKFQGEVFNWKKFGQSSHSLVCRCEKMAREKGYRVFGIRFFAECWGGDMTCDLTKLSKYKTSNKCVGEGYKDCDHSSGKECVGKANGEYVYELNALGEMMSDIDGGFSDWSDWTECSADCGYGVKSRERACTSPIPQGKGKDCSELGNSTEIMECKIKECPVNGGFSEWSLFDTCTKSCGGGTQRRTRSCSNPTPAYGGKSCQGKNEEIQRCNENPCPINGGFTPWSEYSSCSDSCGKGTQKRTRSCTNPPPQYGGEDCSGAYVETKDCGVHPETNEVISKCPVDGGYSEWKPYGPCSETCGGGIQLRTRSCDNPKPENGGRDCSGLGPSTESKGCNMERCPRPLSPEYEKRDCEDNTMYLSCPSGSKLMITYALYGRHTKAHCKKWYPSWFWSTSCEAPPSLNKVRSYCEGRQHCSVEVENDVFGEPCRGTYKYLDVKYRCSGPNAQPHSSIVCENNSHKITCPLGRVIEVTGAIYGRLSTAHCRNNNYHNTNCKAYSSLSKTSSLCNGKPSCYLYASNSVYGDPCNGIHKYLDVTYKCIW